jgi:hypothetical protein
MRKVSNHGRKAFDSNPSRPKRLQVGSTTGVSGGATGFSAKHRHAFPPSARRHC